MDAARYAPDLPQLHRILLIPNVHSFTFFPDEDNPRYQIRPNPSQKLPASLVVKEYADWLANLDSYLRSEML